MGAAFVIKSAKDKGDELCAGAKALLFPALLRHG